MKVVILCGGKGTRLKEHTESIPKPLIEIGGRPILWHIMKLYASRGLNEFVLCLGYKGQMVKDYFRKDAKGNSEKWKIDFADTGEETQTGGRVKRIEPFIREEAFMLTYGDGVADLAIQKLLEFHRGHGRLATVTAVNPPLQFGLLEIGEKGKVRSFVEKPPLGQWINGGFFVFQREIFKDLKEDDILEKAPLERLSREGELVAYQHEGFWKCMDTYKDTVQLNELWASGKAPWKIW